MKMRTSKFRCGRCRMLILRGHHGTRKYGCWWHVSCAVEYTRQRQIARGELTPA